MIQILIYLYRLDAAGGDININKLNRLEKLYKYYDVETNSYTIRLV